MVFGPKIALITEQIFRIFRTEFSLKQAKNFLIFLTNKKLNQQKGQKENYSKPSSSESICF
jgi:hypothetical protein